MCKIEPKKWARNLCNDYNNIHTSKAETNNLIRKIIPTFINFIKGIKLSMKIDISKDLAKTDLDIFEMVYYNNYTDLIKLEDTKDNIITKIKDEIYTEILKRDHPSN